MGLSAHQSTAHRATLLRRGHHPRRSVHGDRRRKLLGIDLATGALGWEGNVTTPKGATELERLADITSLPAVDAREVCAAAYQGRVACFDVSRGTLLWSRDIGSLGGIALDNRYLFITDDKGAIQALDKTTGSSVWNRTSSGRYPSGPVVIGDYLGVVDAEGYLHLLDRNDGRLVGRAATDGKPPLSQPMAAGEAAVWQSASNLISTVGGRAVAVHKPPCARHAVVAKMLPTLVLVGRPNVGKSTLFNRLTASRAALVADFRSHPRSSVRTRARRRPPLSRSSTPADSSRRRRAASCTRWRARRGTAIAESDAVIFMVDGREGLTGAGPHDRRPASTLRAVRCSWP